MITFKQIEALYWIAELGNFALAADKLNTTQSAISKRINELESVFDMEVFDRSRRNAKLTEKGAELLALSKDMLDMRDHVLERMSSPETLHKRFRIGVTELTALTWLPTLVKMISQSYPKLIIEPQVELSSTLLEKLGNDSLDMIIVPDVYDDAAYKVCRLKTVKNAWMCTPDYVLADDVLDFQRLSQLNVLTQSNLSGTGVIYERWFAQNNLKISRTLLSNSLVAQIGLTLSGIGVSYLPIAAMKKYLDSGLLKILHVTPQLPEVRYAALYRADRDSRLYSDVTCYAAETCDFDRVLIGGS
ncbi:MULTISPECIES: LysR family transcriptional regulator [Marinomonas]|uniref:LysR family transcriptional regulator n=1 Tax=Marinomonas rhodophyticola TaxID=2992803 RepID=A0ABT3KB47_9GAMM|nr:LysR family transcriptional regulator [Marinomonas sp. KJ51-3]MCW4627709.1 LysR family transcriptional regulator [Marinomonas sp. KJ51-3]